MQRTAGRERFGRLDFAFNNAGVSLASGNVTEVEVETYDKIFDINVRGNVHPAAWPGLRC